MEVSNVRVAVRARPLSKREVDLRSSLCVGMNGRCTRLFKTVSGIAVGETRDDSKEFEYDHSYWSVDASDDHFISQEQVYKDLGTTVIESAFQGYNACVFAYGQTGSGKTYTMMGTEADPGLVPRICQNLFAKITAGSRKQVSYEVKASYMEIYNEKVRDLLDSNSGKNAVHNLKIREHPKDGPYVENLSHREVLDYGAVSKLMSIGNAHRATASTNMNDVSSRSHAIFSIIFTQAAFSSDVPCETVSRINLVDLAGSERASATGAEGIRLKEGGNINRSLACLGNVISALAEMSSRSSKQKKPFIPYRDSVLTWLLKDSLGGNSRTIMVATISPADVSFGETLSTLRYASRAKNIINKPVVNECSASFNPGQEMAESSAGACYQILALYIRCFQVDPNVRLIRELKTEIQRLKAIITASNLSDIEQGGAKALLSEDIHKKEEQIAELTRTWAGKWKDIQSVIEERNLALHTEGIKMTLASEKPHLLTIDDGTSASGIVLYYLQDGITHIGSETNMSHPEIVLEVEGITPRHCKLNFSSGNVSLIVEEGLCSINSEKIEDTKNLHHGDIIQLGEKVTFRFNHLEAQSQKGDQAPISPLALKTLRDQLDKERKSMQENFDKRVALMQEELEKRSNQEKAELLNQLRRDYSASVSSVDENSESIKDLEPYARMQSVMHTSPSCTPLSSTPDLSKRIVIGQEREAEVHSPNQLTGNFRHHNLSEEDSDLQTGYIDISLVEGNLELSYLNESLEAPTFSENVDTDSRETVINSPENLQQETVKNTRTDLPSGNNSELQSEVKRTQSLLDQARKNEQAAKCRNQRLEASMKRRKEAYESDRAILSEKVERLEAEVRKMNVLDTGARRRCNAFGEKDCPKLRRHSSSRDLHIKRQTVVEIPSFILRGNGFSSYYVYEVKIATPRGDKLSLYKDYSQFKAMHDDLSKKYSAVATLKFPPTKWFGAKRPEFVDKRRQELQNYLRLLLSICVTLPECPLSTIKFYKLTKEDLFSFHSFFHVGDV